jgi:hypothetical protein
LAASRVVWRAVVRGGRGWWIRRGCGVVVLLSSSSSTEEDEEEELGEEAREVPHGETAGRRRERQSR